MHAIHRSPTDAHDRTEDCSNGACRHRAFEPKKAGPSAPPGRHAAGPDQQLPAQFQIRSIPTRVAFKDQIGIFSQPGALPEDALIDLIGQIEAIDKDDVRKDIADQEKADAPA